MLSLRSSGPVTRLILGGALLAAIAGCDRQSPAHAQPGATPAATGATAVAVEHVGIDRSHRGSRLPDLTLADGRHASLRLPTLAGHPLLINLWATWCAACIIELPTLDRIGAGGHTRVIAVAEDSTHTDAVAPFLTAHGIAHLGAWLDPDGALSTQYQVNNMPTSIYYGADGREVWRFTGGNDWDSAGGRALLAEAHRQ